MHLDWFSVWFGGLFVFMVFLAFVDKKTSKGLSIMTMATMAVLWPLSLLFIVIGTLKEVPHE